MVKVYDLFWKALTTLANGVQDAGVHSVASMEKASKRDVLSDGTPAINHKSKTNGRHEIAASFDSRVWGVSRFYRVHPEVG